MIGFVYGLIFIVTVLKILWDRVLFNVHVSNPAEVYGLYLCCSDQSYFLLSVVSVNCWMQVQVGVEFSN